MSGSPRGARLFGVHGYRMTSMAAIAQEAGVAERTVYTVFGAKREILSAICETWLGRCPRPPDRHHGGGRA